MNQGTISNTEKVHLKLKKFLQKWVLAIYHYKQCYFAAITHIVDQVTDIAVIIEFIDLWLLEDRYQKKYGIDICPDINAKFLTFSSITTFILYRIVSAANIYRMSNSWKRFFFQLLDLELFRAMRVNYINGKHEPCYPQQQIRYFEAMLESTPQTLIQLFFIIKSNQQSTIVYISTICSFFMIATKAMAEDKLGCKADYRNGSLDKTNVKNVLKYPWIKRKYLFRAFYRVADIIYRLFVALLLWLFVGGAILFVVMVVECAAVFRICHVTDELSRSFPNTTTCYLFVPIPARHMNT